ncbi:tRNA pseudouridine38-40 synthase, variant [Fonticula alba]|uniref:tRNA pseudouridine38-40 synthase, variant n=1 Tax=Fonticula alba TaxID=691883 RepID=A0A058ZD03_FONAL|nr:tRNA pseudouridine38-40 synthase, variant [Fonticula alba]KCV72290.1 tRNA pseudouridine38-40 synthase, variant [Fonticula alba]|eukprot:XP_009493867.1 tRNA pseudouridine38-40 synthase, variant [Fonticula alba]
MAVKSRPRSNLNGPQSAPHVFSLPSPFRAPAAFFSSSSHKSMSTDESLAQSPVMTDAPMSSTVAGVVSATMADDDVTTTGTKRPLDDTESDTDSTGKPARKKKMSNNRKRAFSRDPNDSDDDIDTDIPRDAEGRRLPRRKVAMLVAFSGRNYHGMQINKELPTIEKELFQALVGANLVPAGNLDCPQKFKFMRAARTDRGVHAAGMVVSLKMVFQPEVIGETIRKLNELLPADIAVIDIRRTINSFHAKNHCDARVYEYLIPTYMFAPNPESAERALTAARALQAMHAAQPAPGSEPAAPAATEVEAAPAAAAPPKRRAAKRRGGNRDGDDDSGPESDSELGTEDVATDLGAFADIKYIPPRDLENSPFISPADRAAFRIDAALLDRVRLFLRQYEGTKNFHNYTSGKLPTDPSAKRIIHWFRCAEPRIIDGVEWVPLQVKGQSFMMHQIRRMVGLVVALLRVGAPEGCISLTLGSKACFVPRAPGAGLFLDQILFESYSRRLISINSEQPPLDWNITHQETIAAFKQSQIYPSMVEAEQEDQFAEFLDYVDRHSILMSYVWDQAHLTADEPASAGIDAAKGTAPEASS